MTFDFHPEAEAELAAAAAFYEDHAEGLGLGFAAEVHEAIERAIAMPLAWAQIEPGIRRVLVRRAPNYWAHRAVDLEGGGK